MSGLPDGIANGPNQSNLNGNDAQVWERPWTLDEMRQTSANWSLAADSGLFLFLQDFSQRMLSKTHEIEKQLDGLIRDTKATDCCLHTVFNDFLMLSNTQFIENRVYDEEVEESLPKPEATERQPEPEKTREQKEAELIPKMQEAVNYGLRVLDSAFEQLDIKAGNSDSEDEEAADRVEPILEAKDLYVDRPLPYLIGSQLFMVQEDVGLGDLSSEEMSIDSDRDSVIESEDGQEADRSDEDFGHEEEGKASVKKKSSMLSLEEEEEEEEDGDSDIFGDSDKDDDDDDENTGPSSFADELAARIKVEPSSKPEGDRTSPDHDGDQMFEPPKMEDEDFSPFGGKGGLFSGGKGLFDDDEEGDLFSDAPKPSVAEEKIKSSAQTSEPAKSGKKKLASSAVSVFPDTTLFGSGNDSDSVGSRENGTPVKAPGKPTPGAVGGLFDDEEEDDFFSGKSLPKPCSAGQEKATVKKTVDLFGGDDEEEEEEEGDIFSESSRAPPPLPSKKEPVDDPVEPAAPQKKMPAGGISMFGPGTRSVLSEALKKRQVSTSEESEKSEENGPPPVITKAPAKLPEKPQTRGLFSDDEDTQVIPTLPKSRSKPEPTTAQRQANSAPLSIFDDDDEEEEDLFAAAAKSKPTQAKGTPSLGHKPVSSSLFSDDEDQWMSTKASGGGPEAKAGGMKPSVSAPSCLPSARAPPKSSLFEDADDDLFGAVKESSQKKPQRVALLFQDEEDEEGKGSLFGVKPAVNSSTPSPADKQASVVPSLAPSLFDTNVAVLQTSEGKSPEKRESTPEVQSPMSPPEGSEAKKKPVGAVSLFGGIDVLAKKLTKSPLDEPDGDDDFLSKDSLPPVEKERKEEMEKKDVQEVKAKNNTLSLFDAEEEEEGVDWTTPISIPSSKPASKNTSKAKEEGPRTKSTGVFLDEELLFSQTQQRDNDPDVDLFATPAKAASAKPSSAKSTAPTLFADDDDDDLFGSSGLAPKVPEKPRKPEPAAKPAAASVGPESEKPDTSPGKAKEPRSRIGKLQTNLLINPAALLPGAVPPIPGGVGGVPGSVPAASPRDPSPSPVSSPVSVTAPGPVSITTPSPVSITAPSPVTITAPSPVTSTLGVPQDARDGGVSFDSPAQVATLQSANKGRTKGSLRRRPQTRGARQQAAQNSVEESEETQESPGPSSGPSPVLPTPVLPNLSKPVSKLPSPTPPSPTNPEPTTAQPSDVPIRPSVLTLPASTNPPKTESVKSSSKPSSKASVPAPPEEEDLFSSDSLFGSGPAPKRTSPSTQSQTTAAEEVARSSVAASKEREKDAAPSIFDARGEHLFQKVKPRSAQKAQKASPFLEEDLEEPDIFGSGRGTAPKAAPKAGSTSTKQDIFQEKIEPLPQANKKHKEKALEASLFDDNIDIFADLNLSSKPKEKKAKKKVETKSIFDDDMDDIFSSSTAKPVAKPSVKSKKTPPSLDTSTAEDSTGDIFDDPLNALGGN